MSDAYDPETGRRLVELLDILKSKGVSAFNGLGIAVTFAQPGIAQSQSELASSLKALTDSPPMCKCGHPEAAHTDGLCLAGCSAEKCAPEE